MSRRKTKGGSTPLHLGNTPYAMLDFPALEKLSAYKSNVLKVYLCMYAQCYSDKRSLYAQWKNTEGNYDMNNPTICRFSQKDMKHYHIDHKTAEDCIAILEKIGAVKVIERNKHRKMLNVYQLVRWDRWKEESSPEEQTISDGNKSRSGTGKNPVDNKNLW